MNAIVPQHKDQIKQHGAKSFKLWYLSNCSHIYSLLFLIWDLIQTHKVRNHDINVTALSGLVIKFFLTEKFEFRKITYIILNLGYLLLLLLPWLTISSISKAQNLATIKKQTLDIFS